MGKDPKVDEQEVEAFEPEVGWATGTQGRARFDGDFITIERKGMRARMTVGKGTKRIPLVSVTAVQLKPAGSVMNGFIQFTVPGGNEGRSRFGHQTADAVKDENSVVFTKKNEADFEALRDAVEQAIVAHHRPVAAVAAQAAPDVMAQLKQLGELRDAGVVTDEEFDAKKAELLARL